MGENKETIVHNKKKIIQESKKICLEVNKEKTKIKGTLTDSDEVDFIMDDYVFEETQSFKYLGVQSLATMIAVLKKPVVCSKRKEPSLQ